MSSRHSGTAPGTGATEWNATTFSAPRVPPVIWTSGNVEVLWPTLNDTSPSRAATAAVTPLTSSSSSSTDERSR